MNETLWNCNLSYYHGFKERSYLCILKLLSETFKLLADVNYKVPGVPSFAARRNKKKKVTVSVDNKDGNIVAFTCLDYTLSLDSLSSSVRLMAYSFLESIRYQSRRI